MTYSEAAGANPAQHFNGREENFQMNREDTEDMLEHYGVDPNSTTEDGERRGDVFWRTINSQENSDGNNNVLSYDEFMNARQTLHGMINHPDGPIADAAAPDNYVSDEPTA